MEYNNYKVHSKETFYLYIKVFFTLVFYVVVAYLFFYTDSLGLPFIKYIAIGYFALIAFVVFFRFGVIIGYLRGNSIKVTKEQFGYVYNIVEAQCAALGIKKIPDVYVLQTGGLLNAFATRFNGRNYIVIFSEILEEAYNGKPSIDFVIAHELGHIKRNHLTKNMLLFPANLIPFLSNAYSRACEYTCDSIGQCLSPKGAKEGLMLLATGKQLRGYANSKLFIHQIETESGFWFWVSEKFSTHPHLCKRLAALKNVEIDLVEYTTSVKEDNKKDTKNSGHSNYLPK